MKATNVLCLKLRRSAMLVEEVKHTESLSSVEAIGKEERFCNNHFHIVHLTEL